MQPPLGASRGQHIHTKCIFSVFIDFGTLRTKKQEQLNGEWRNLYEFMDFPSACGSLVFHWIPVDQETHVQITSR